MTLHDSPLNGEGEDVGQTLKANIALAMVETKYLKGDIWTEIYYEKELRHNHKVARCTVQDKPFW